MTCDIKQPLSHYPIDQYQFSFFLTGTLASFNPINWLYSFKVDLTWFQQDHTIQSCFYYLIISTDHQAPILLCCLQSIATSLKSPSFLLSYSSLTALLQSDSFYLKLLWFYISLFSFSLFHWFYHFPFWSPLNFSFSFAPFGLLVYITCVLHPTKKYRSFSPHNSVQQFRQSAYILLIHLISLSVIL